MCGKSKRVLRVLTTTLLAAIPQVSDSFAQGSLETSHSARSFGMASTGVADGSDPSTVQNNPAVAGWLSGVFVTGFVNQLSSELTIDQNLRGLAVSGGHQILGRGEFAWGLGGELRVTRRSLAPHYVRVYQGITVGEFVPWEGYLSATVGTGFRFANTARIQIGVTYKSWEGETVPYFVNWPNPRTYQWSDDVWDLGALLVFRSGDPDVWSVDPAIGFSLRNRGGEILSAEQTTFGMSLLVRGPFEGKPHPAFTAVFNGEIQYFQQGWTDWSSYCVGMEFAVRRAVFFRLGFRSAARYSQSVCLGLGLGLPLEHYLIRFDYSASPDLDLNDPWSSGTSAYHKLSLTVGWISSVPSYSGEHK